MINAKEAKEMVKEYENQKEAMREANVQKWLEIADNAVKDMAAQGVCSVRVHSNLDIYEEAIAKQALESLGYQVGFHMGLIRISW